MKKNTRFLILTLIPFILILVGGSFGFVHFMQQLTHANKRTELLQLVETQRFNLEAQVNNEVNIVLQMANSAAVVAYFENPGDEELRRIGHAELNRFGTLLRTGAPFWVNNTDLIFYMDGVASYILDPYDPASPWYHRTMRYTPIFNFNINYNPDLQQTNFWINAPVRDSVLGLPIGILGTGVNLTEFIDAIFRGHRGAARLYFFNYSGEITGARDMGLVEETALLYYILPYTGPSILQWVRNWAPDNVRTWSGPEGEIAVRYIPTMQWYVVAIEGLTLLDYLATNMTYLFLGIMGTLILFFVILQIGKNMYDTINRIRFQLKVERDIIAIMKDNLDVGIFLMDKDLLIQDAYSKSLENILNSPEIKNKKLTDFLTSSFNEKDLEQLNEYFNMVINRKYSDKKLIDLNPISEFIYTNPNGEKTLKATFAPVNMDETNVYIIGTLEDITTTKELERQLKAEASKRDDEVETLLQVIEVKPEVFDGFIADVEKELAHINNVLKTESHSQQSVLAKMFQSVHAMKSNALVLGLTGFMTKFHELENNIKKLQTSERIDSEDILSVLDELEGIMKERDKYERVISKINAYKNDSSEVSYETTLSEFFSRACSEISKNLNKRVKLVTNITKFSEKYLSPIKEIIIQLMRNSIYHGIQSSGTIEISITEDANNVNIDFSDDGKGLDLDKIGQKALQLNLIKEEDLTNRQKLYSVLFSPGFSTSDSVNENAGRGVGLDLVGERIKENNGKIKIFNELNKGTKFNFSIPVA